MPQIDPISGPHRMSNGMRNQGCKIEALVRVSFTMVKWLQGLGGLLPLFVTHHRIASFLYIF
jgi:hypothetical protein